MRFQNGLIDVTGMKSRYSDAEIKVDPQVLTEKSFVVQDSIKDITMLFEELEALINKTSAYWRGAGGEHYRTEYKSKKDDIMEILNRLDEHPEELRLMANNYTEVERRTTEQNSRLRSDYV